MTITFDFDSTLTVPVMDDDWDDPDIGPIWVNSDDPNVVVHDILKTLAAAGHDILIVTTRSNDWGMWDFVKLHNLPIAAIHCTSGQDKFHTLLALGVDLHFDDCPHDIKMNLKAGIKTICVPHPFDVQHKRIDGDWITIDKFDINNI